MAFSFLWLLSDQMPGQWMKGKLCSFSFTPVGTLPFIKVSVGAGSVPCSVLLEYRPNKDMYSFNVLHWVSPVQSHGTVSSQVALLFSKQFISLCRPWPHVSSSHPLWGQNPGCFSWTGHSQLWGEVNKQDLFINSSLSSQFSESSHLIWNGNPSWAGCFWHIRCSLLTRSDWFLPFIPPHPVEHNTRYFPCSIVGKAKKPKGTGNSFQQQCCWSISSKQSIVEKGQKIWKLASLMAKWQQQQTRGQLKVGCWDGARSHDVGWSVSIEYLEKRWLIIGTWNALQSSKRVHQAMRNSGDFLIPGRF